MKDKLTYIELILIGLYAWACMSPELNLLIGVEQFFAFELAYSIFVAFQDEKPRKIVIVCLLSAFLIAVLYFFLTDCQTLSMDIANRDIKIFVQYTHSYYAMVFPLLMFYRLHTLATSRQKLILLIFISIILIDIFIVTLEEMAINPSVLKSQMAAKADSDINKKVGGYYFVQSVPIMAVGTFYCFMRSSKLAEKYGMLALTIFFVTFLISSYYTIALLAAFLGFYACIFVEVKATKKALMIVVPILMWAVFLAVLSAVIENIEAAGTQNRLKDLYHFMSTGDLGNEDLAERFRLYGEGLTAFFDSPFVGNYHMKTNSHSTIIEVLADVGIAGGIVLFVLWKKGFSEISKLITKFKYSPIFITFLLSALTNPVHSSLAMNIALFLLVPVLFDVVKVKKRDDEVLVDDVKELEN